MDLMHRVVQIVQKAIQLQFVVWSLYMPYNE